MGAFAMEITGLKSSLHDYSGQGVQRAGIVALAQLSLTGRGF